MVDFRVVLTKLTYLSILSCCKGPRSGTRAKGISALERKTLSALAIAGPVFFFSSLGLQQVTASLAMMDKQTATSLLSSVGAGSLRPEGEPTAKPFIAHRPLASRQNPTAMLSRNKTFPAAGKRIGGFWRRRLASRRARAYPPGINGGVAGTSAPAPRRGASTLPKRGQPIEFPDSFEPAFYCKLERRERNGREFLNFDGLETYNVSREVEYKLRRDEARRLLKVAQDPTKPIRLGPSGVLEAMQGDEAGYRVLSRMSATISIALNLCLLDNEYINLEFCPQLANRDRLQKMIRRAQVLSLIHI